MPTRVVRFPQGARHGRYLGQDKLVGLLPGCEARWRSVWEGYATDSDQSFTDLQFADDEQRVEFRRDLGLWP